MDAWVAIFILLVLTWAVGLGGVFMVVRQFRMHTDTIRRLQDWQDLMLEKMTKPKGKGKA